MRSRSLPNRTPYFSKYVGASGYKALQPVTTVLTEPPWHRSSTLDDRVSGSGGIDPGCAGHRGIARSGDRLAVSTPGRFVERSRGPRTSTPIATMQHERKPILGKGT